MNALVLIIDDSELIVQMLDMICQQAGYRTLTCVRIGQVKDAIADEIPAAIISDLNLPDLAGLDPVVALHDIDGLGATPVIIVSGMEPHELDAHAQSIGADAAISKASGLPAMQAKLPTLLAQLT